MDELTQPALISGLQSKTHQDHTHPQANKEFELLLGDLPFAEDYAGLINEGLSWREAAVLAWQSTPEEHRQPKKKGELAKLLGCGPSVISKILKRKHINARILASARAQYLEALPDIIDAGIEVAKKPSYKSTPERNNIAKLIGLQRDELIITPGKADDLENLSMEDLEQLAGEADNI